MEKILTKKIDMTQIFDEEGRVYPVTRLERTGEEESNLSEGDMVAVSGISKGKGFQGVVKRHGFKGGRRTHGQKHSEREPGSIGGGGRAGGRVVKGMRMAGRMGGKRVTEKNLRVVKIDEASKEIYIGGAVPGRRGTVIEIRKK